MMAIEVMGELAPWFWWYWCGGGLEKPAPAQVMVVMAAVEVMEELTPALVMVVMVTVEVIELKEVETLAKIEGIGNFRFCDVRRM